MTTLQKIADASGYSINAVSRILNHQNKENRPSSIARAAEIRQLAKKMGYRPNTAAQAMKHGVFKSVMLLKSGPKGFAHLPDTVLLSIQQALNPLGYKLMFTALPEHITVEKEFPRFFRESCVDGILISVNRNIPSWLGELLEEMNVPKVWIGSKQKNDCVRHDDFNSSYKATELLLAKGHRRIVYADILSPQSEKQSWHFSAIDRMDGYKQSMRDAGYEPVVVRPEEALEQVEQVDYLWESLFRTHQPTAVVAYGMTFTGRGLLYACARNRIRIPEELSFVTWNDEACAENGIELSCFTPSRLGVGTVAANLLYDLIQTPGKHVQPNVLPFEFSGNGSIGNPHREP